MKNFWNVLFNDDESTCISENLFGTTLTNVHWPRDFKGPLPQFFVINPLKEKRADANVTAYRNILVEFDGPSITEQHDLLKSSGLPYSTLVYSGSKSIHAIVSLEEPLATELEYRALADTIFKRIGADPANKNPSRFSRTPGAIRDNGQEQSLLEVRERIPLEVLIAWTGPIEPHRPISEQVSLGSRLLPIRVHAFLKYGAPEGSRNATLFANACEMFRAGFSEDEIIDMVLRSPLDLPMREIRTCIRSARNANH